MTYNFVSISARSIAFSIVVPLGLVVLFLQADATGQIIFENNFDQHPAGLYTEDNLDADFNSPVWEDGVREGRISIVEGAEAFGGSGSSLAVLYPAGEHGTKETGGQWKLDFDEEYEEAYLSYRIKFKSGFDFVRGGKLPGLAGGTAPTGSTSADGFNGWTGRMMWRTEFEGTSGSPEQLTSNAISYAKYTDSGVDGDGSEEDKLFWFGADDNLKTLNSGQWYQITQRVKLNQPGVSDGILKIWIDGELVHDQTDVLFRETADLKIDLMYFSTFFGGNSDWKTSKDETVYFDDFEISTPRNAFLRVPEDFATVEEALDEAIHGDSVAVRNLHVGNFVIDKQILFRGYVGTKLFAADTSKPTISVEFQAAEIKRIDVRNGTQGVFVQPNCEDVLINYMQIRNSITGISIGDNCHRCLLYKNDMINIAQDGILISNSDDIRIYSNNTMLSGANGINLINTDSARVKDCRAYFNDNDGFRVSGSNLDLIDNKSFFNLSSGFFLNTDDSDVRGNDARENDNNGIEFADSFNNSVTGNLARGNHCTGFLLDATSLGNSVSQNYANTNSVTGFLDNGANDVTGNFADDGTGQ